MPANTKTHLKKRYKVWILPLSLSLPLCLSLSPSPPSSSQISEGSVEETLTGEVVLSVLRVTVTKPALYTCLASNRHSAGANTVKATARVTVAGRTSSSPAQHPTP